MNDVECIKGVFKLYLNDIAFMILKWYNTSVV